MQTNVIATYSEQGLWLRQAPVNHSFGPTSNLPKIPLFYSRTNKRKQIMIFGIILTHTFYELFAVYWSSRENEFMVNYWWNVDINFDNYKRK